MQNIGVMEPARTNLGLKVAVAVIGAVAAGLVVALVLVASSASSDTDDNSQRIAKLERQLSAEQPTSQPARIRRLTRRVKLLEDCLPEMQTEIDSLELDSDTYFISTSNQVSRVCYETVFGSTPFGE